MKMKKFFLVFCVFSVGYLISALFGAFVSDTVKGDFLVHMSEIVILLSIAHCLYSFLFVWIDSFFPQSLRVVFGYSLSVSLLLSLIGCLGYAHTVDRIAVNEGMKELTMYEKIITSDGLFWGILGASLVGYFALVLCKKRRA